MEIGLLSGINGLSASLLGKIREIIIQRINALMVRTGPVWFLTDILKGKEECTYTVIGFMI